MTKLEKYSYNDRFKYIYGIPEEFQISSYQQKISVQWVKHIKTVVKKLAQRNRQCVHTTLHTQH